MSYEKDEKAATHVGKHGDHPVGGMMGAAVGGVAGGVAAGAIQGAIYGTAAGPVGTAGGAVVGGVIGALAGKAIAQNVNPTTEDVYWREHHRERPYVKSGVDYDTTYGPAYMYGVDAYNRYEGKRFDDIEGDLRRDWALSRGNSSLEWEDASPASRDAYDRIHSQVSTKETV